MNSEPKEAPTVADQQALNSPPVSFYLRADDTTSQQQISLVEALEGIKTGRWQDGVLDVRERLKTAETKADRSAIKKQVPNFTVSGTFGNRKDDSLIKHSGYIAIDLDYVDELPAVRQKLQTDRYVYAMFASISGKGLCVIMRIDGSQHKDEFARISAYFQDVYNLEVDQSAKNVSRTRYVSYDPELWLNEEAIPFDWEPPAPELPTGVASASETPNQTVGADIESVIAYIEKNSIDITGSYQNWVSVGFALANEYGEEGRAYFHRVSSQYTGYNEAETEAKYTNLLKDNNGQTQIGSFFYHCKQAGVPIGRTVGNPSQFWQVVRDGEAEKLIILRRKIKDFLHDKGFRKIYLTPNVPTLVRADGMILREVNAHVIRNFILNDYIPNLPYSLPASKRLTRDDLAEALLKGINVYLSEQTLEMVKTLEWVPLPTDAKTAFFLYRNAFIQVTPNGAILKDYAELPGHVWYAQIIQRDISKVDTDTLESGQFCRFMQRISQHDSDETKSQQRFEALMSYTGFMLHFYKDPALSKTLVLMDQNTSDRAEGGTGKGLYLKGLKHVQNTVIMDARNFSFDKNFAWQNMNVDTQIVALDDVGRKFPYERMFSLVTDDWPVEKKNKQAFIIPAERSPKTVITTNYVLEGQGQSFERRLILFELSRHFHLQHTPQQEFGGNLFTDWDSQEWNLFDNWMIYCTAFYLVKGLIATETITAKKRQLEQQVPEEILSFLEDFVQRKTVGSFFSKAEIMQEISVQQFVQQVYSTQKMTKFVQAFNELADSGYRLEEGRYQNKRGFWLTVQKVCTAG